VDVVSVKSKKEGHGTSWTSLVMKQIETFSMRRQQSLLAMAEQLFFGHQPG
jgi:hypothetical protein